MKTTYYRIKLRFKGPLHLSKGQDVYEEGESILHSDTLHGALMASMYKLGRPTGKDSLPQWKISSAFPFYDEHYFYPKPMAALPFAFFNQQGDDQADFRKDFKKITWIEESLFIKSLAGEELKLHQNCRQGGFLVPNRETAQKLAEVKIYEKSLTERVTISRHAESGDDSEPFYFEKWFFNPQAGLHFLVETSQWAEQKETLLRALTLLADEGIGADRAVGCGHFDFDPDRDVETVHLDLPKGQNYWCNLSLYCPLKSELEQIDTAQSAFALKKRGGYIAAPRESRLLNIRKRSVNMLKEGGVWCSPKVPYGKWVNLRPDYTNENKLPTEVSEKMHDIWRDGRALFFPMVKFQKD